MTYQTWSIAERERTSGAPAKAGSPASDAAAPNLERAAQLLEDLTALWLHPGVTHKQRESLVREVFRRITIDGKEFVSIEPQAAYVPLFATMVADQKLGYRALEPLRLHHDTESNLG